MNAYARILAGISLALGLLLVSQSALAVPTPLLRMDRDAALVSAWDFAWGAFWQEPDANVALISPDFEVDFGVFGLPSAAEVTSLMPSSRPQPASTLTAPLTEYGRLYVESTPANASVRILNCLTAFQQGMALTPGSYVVEIQSTGHATVVRQVDVVSGMAATVTVAMAPLTAPEVTNASVLDPLAATDEQLAKQLATPALALRPVVDTPNLVTVPKVLTLNRQMPADNTGKLFVQTYPADTLVRVLNIRPKFQQGMELAPGEYRVDASRPGFTSVTQTVRVVAGTENVVSFTLQPTGGVGRLYVETYPSRAVVRILNIRPKFQQGMELDPGQYTIDAQCDGYRAQTRNVSIQAGVDTRIQLDLIADQSKPQALAPALPEIQPLAKSTAQAPARKVYETSPARIAECDREAYLDMARLALGIKDYAGVIRSAQKAINLDRDSAEAYGLLGEAYLRLHDYDKALRHLNMALTLVPEETTFLANKTQAMQESEALRSKAPSLQRSPGAKVEQTSALGR